MSSDAELEEEITKHLKKFDEVADIDIADDVDEEAFNYGGRSGNWTAARVLSIKHNNHRDIIHLDLLHLDTVSIVRLGCILKKGIALKRLSIDGRESGLNGGLAICAGLRFNRSITELSLCNIEYGVRHQTKQDFREFLHRQW